MIDNAVLLVVVVATVIVREVGNWIFSLVNRERVAVPQLW